MLVFKWFFAFILLSFLSFIPLPHYFECLRPLWFLMVLLYLQLIFPERFHYAWLLIAGILLDEMLSTPLGTHVFAFTVVAIMALAPAKRFKFFSTIQQMIWIFLLLMMYQFVWVAMLKILGASLSWSFILLPVLSTTLVWPVFCYFVRKN